MQQQTIDSLGVAVGRLEQLVADISSRGKETTDAMSAQLASTLASMEERQRAINEQTQALVDTMRSQVAQSQQDATSSMQQAIDRMIGSMALYSLLLHSLIFHYPSILLNNLPSRV